MEKKELVKKNWKLVGKVGLEFEGAWKRERVTGPDAVSLHSDGSVRVYREGYITGEHATEPVEADDVVKIKQVFDRYPDLTDTSCGFHVHVSFKEINHYLSVMTEEFYNYFLKQMELLVPKLPPVDQERLLPRLRGDNTYCKRVFAPNRQVYDRSKSGYRYAHLNFCYGLHQTMEVRLFPMFSSRAVAEKALQYLLTTIRSWIRKNIVRKKSPRRVLVTVEEITVKREVLVF